MSPPTSYLRLRDRLQCPVYIAMATVRFWVLTFLSFLLLTVLHKDGGDQSNQSVGFTDAEPSVRVRWCHQNHLIKVSTQNAYFCTPAMEIFIHEVCGSAEAPLGFQSSPGDSDVQPGLGKTDLGQSLLKT